MKLIASYAALAFLSGALALPSEPPPWGDEEFVGPFPSWKDVKAHYGAKGDGARTIEEVRSRLVAPGGPLDGPQERAKENEKEDQGT